MRCPVCYYQLHKTATPTCPECGSRISLRLISPAMRFRAWTTGLIALCIPFGFASLFGILMPLVGLVNGRLSARVLQTTAIFAGAALMMGIAIGVLVGRRRAFARSSPRTQWLVVAGAGGLGLPLLIWLMALAKDM